jgi:hypothetical protein
MSINLVKKELSQDDWELIISAMMDTTVSKKSISLLNKSTMPKEDYERYKIESDRLVYLVNVLNGIKPYSCSRNLVKSE